VRPYRLLAAVAVVTAVVTTDAWADALLYRCGPNVCRAAPNGTAKQRLTTGAHVTWLSASGDGSRLAVADATFAYVLDARGRRIGGKLPRGGTVVIAEISPDGSQVATVELLPEITPAPVGSPPGSPGLSGFQPYLFLMNADGTGRTAVARAVVDAAWAGARLARTDTARTAPFPLGVCVLANNTDFPCGSDAARDPGRDLFNPAFSPGGREVAVVSAGDVQTGAGEVIVYDVASAKPARSITDGRNAQPTWSPDGRRIAYEHGGDISVVRSDPPVGRAVLHGRQPVWTSARACRSKPRLRLRRRVVIVTACAPQPGRLTVTLRRNGRAVARKSVRAPTGGLVKVRLSRPAGKLRASARVRQRATTLR
jgi:dipeptidyl aminopeptidase/acylaminoacyl peptidase